MCNPHFICQKIFTDQSASIFWSKVQIHLSVSHCCSFLLAPTLCSAVQPIPFFLLLLLFFFKADTAGYVQNDLFSVSLSKLKIICYIAMSPVATGLHFLPTRALSHERRLRDAYISVRGISCKIAFKKQSSRSNLQEADLAERCDSSLPYFLFNCSLDFGCDG